MKKTYLILTLTAASIGCSNHSGGGNITDTGINDSVNKQTIAPTPGLGSDPTRVDASKENPIGGQPVDSSVHKSDAGEIPGLGNDPTRNDASKNPSAIQQHAAPATDTVRRKKN